MSGISKVGVMFFFLFLKIRSGQMGMTKPVAGRYCNWNGSALFGTGIITPWGALHYRGDEPIKLLYQANPSVFFFRVAWLVGL